MSRLKAGLIVGMAALLFGGAAVFYFFRGDTKTGESEVRTPAAVVAQEGVGQVPDSCIKPKTFVMTQEKKIEEYRKTVEAAIEEAKARGASEEEIKQQTEQLAKSIASIALTQQAIQGMYLDQSDFFQVTTEQEPGRSLRVKHVQLAKPGFVVVSPPLIGTPDENKPTAIHFLEPGTHNDIALSLNRYMDRFEAYVTLYEDNGDKVFNRSQDRVMTYRRAGAPDNALDAPALIKVRFKSDTSATEYQSAYLAGKTKWTGLTMFDQVPGDLVNVYVARSYTPAWVAVHESNGGCAGKVLGTYSLIDEPDVIAMAKKSGTYTPELAERFKDMQRQKNYFDVPLSRSVKNETLIAVLYEDNGDSRFDLTMDKPMRGANDAVIGVEFPVIRGRE